MRDKTAEHKLMKIGMKYYQKMWAQVPIPKNMVTPMKKTLSEIQTQQNSILQNRPRQFQTKTSRCLNFNTETKLNERSECKDVTPKIGAMQNDLDEVLYSEEEGLTDLIQVIPGTQKKI